MKTLFLAVLISAVPLFAGDDVLAKTPPMGWNSWNHFECKVSDKLIRETADAIVASGMKAAGYVYVNIDDCWQGKRDGQGSLQGNERFPDMKALADYIHSKGMKIGIYSSPGPKTCAGYEGSYGHEQQDARTFAAWGVDYLKYDRCSFQGSTEEMIAAYKKMGDALRASGRPIVYSLCQYGMNRVWSWGPSVGAQLWRTTGDIDDIYEIMAFNGFGQNGLERFAGPGRWNDPDMLEVGNGKMGLEPYRQHMSLWCILAAPLLAGNDVTSMKPEVVEILTNPEVLAVNQDPAGKQGYRLWQEGPLEVWMKPLADGSRAVSLFNRGNSTMNIAVRFEELGIGDLAQVRDLWAKKDLGTFRDQFAASVKSRGVVMIRVRQEEQ